ncbi:MAG: hypothetical protein ACRDQ0_14780 [Pseudonocardia sp.]
MPLLWVYASGPAGVVGLMVNVLATPGGLWAYHEAERGRRGYLGPCGDAKAAAEQVNGILAHRLFSDTP